MAISFSFAGCCAHADETAVIVLDAPLRLQFRPSEGDSRLIRLHVIQNATQVSAKKKSSFRQEITLDNFFQVLPASPDGTSRLKATVRATRYLRTIDGVVTESYDSTQPIAVKDKPLSGNAELLALMPGTHFTLLVNSDGSIGGVEDKEAYVEQMMDKMEIGAESRKTLRPFMQSSLEGNAFKNIGITFASFAAREIGIGDSWPKRDTVANDWNLIYDGTLMLAQRSAGQSTLHLKSEMKPDPQRKPEAYVLPLRGTQTGYYFVDEASGWTKRGLLEQRWSGSLDEFGQFVTPGTKGSRPLYMKMTFHIGTL
jgi:hypothetical protein